MNTISTIRDHLLKYSNYSLEKQYEDREEKIYFLLLNDNFSVDMDENLYLMKIWLLFDGIQIIIFE